MRVLNSMTINVRALNSMILVTMEIYFMNMIIHKFIMTICDYVITWKKSKLTVGIIFMELLFQNLQVFF